jgi:hypothetical protein
MQWCNYNPYIFRIFIITYYTLNISDIRVLYPTVYSLKIKKNYVSIKS